MKVKVLKKGNLKLIVDVDDIRREVHVTKKEQEESIFCYYDINGKDMSYEDYKIEALKIAEFAKKVRNQKLGFDIFDKIKLTSKGKFNRKSRYFTLTDTGLNDWVLHRTRLNKIVVYTLRTTRYMDNVEELGITEDDCKKGNVAILTFTSDTSPLAIMDLEGNLL